MNNKNTESKTGLALQTFIPHDAPMERFAVDGLPDWRPIWSPATKRYNALMLQCLRFDLLERGCSVLMNPGLIIDGASVPQRFWDSIGSPYASRYLLAAILHDLIYIAELFGRAICDAIFAEFMKDLGVVYWRREAMYLATRWRGWKPWNKHTEESRAVARKCVCLVDLGENSDFPVASWKEPEKILISEGMFDIGGHLKYA